METWAEESAATAVTWAVVDPPDTQEQGCGGDSRARVPAAVGPFDLEPAEVASARVAATSSSCYTALGQRFFFPSFRHSSRHL